MEWTKRFVCLFINVLSVLLWWYYNDKKKPTGYCRYYVPFKMSASYSCHGTHQASTSWAMNLYFKFRAICLWLLNEYQWWDQAKMYHIIRLYSRISDICRNKNGPVSRHFNNADNICFGAEYDMILYPIEQIPDQGNAQRNKSLRLKRELQWIKTLDTQFPHGMNHKIVRKRDIFITFSFSNNARKAFKITKDIYTKLQKMYPNVFKGELMCSFKGNKTLGDYLVSAKLK